MARIRKQLRPDRLSGLRVLVLNHNLREHGTYFRAWKIATILARRGARVTFATTSTERWYRSSVRTIEGITVHEMPNWAPLHHPDEGWGPLNLAARLKLAAGTRWDLVYCFSHRPVDQLPARLARRLHGAQWLCDWCDLYGEEGINAMIRQRRGQPITWQDFLRDAADRLDERLECAAARSCDLLTVISTDLAARAARLGRSPRATHKMVSGADLDAIQPLDRVACRQELGLPSGRLYLGYIANYHPDERLLLDALVRVFCERPDIDLVVAGPGFYGGEEALQSRGIAHRIHSFGRVPFARIATHLGAADILLVPMTDSPFNRSRWPNKIGDYLAAGRPLVACRVGDVGPFLDKHPVGEGSAPDSEDFACAILKLAAKGEQLAELGQQARFVAEAAFEWDGIVDRLLAHTARQRRRAAS
jgi:glycosyltransferase involved in cell wall biosynthesis